ncbi:squalene/phytoene synthase family protein [Hyalangium rubrum]|uniref:Squalene/phytoene synthase family protein n=1 Tax=Hyalangium rubrum TaxID=3103134 RepID=A0ABU5HFT5_9BACT|nr:squalene/phytoene synthase family protein [Hyalangium sp. s54d21]MDY7232226.1 squalene/phytoene synthase family protein [Hyalangium sp. s54d21]
MMDAPVGPASPLSDSEVTTLLERTSRTFALAIPLLEQPLRREVGLAYLLLRVADTLEDAATWTREQRRTALTEMEVLIEGGAGPGASELAHRWLALCPSEDAGYLQLLEHTPQLLASLEALRPEAGAILRQFVLRTVRGMREVLARATEQGLLTLGSLEELRAYCYVVAGLVGELLTELFLLDERLTTSAPRLRALAPLFGEALQLVNVLKDATQDREQGRSLLPESVRLEDVHALAASDIVEAARYVRVLHSAGASRGVLAFTSLPLQLAHSSLELLSRKGPGAKVSRSEVASQMEALQEALQRGVLPDDVNRLAQDR